ncbi:MAG: RNA polymerase factor sigma-54 [Planctomycetota bacterium]
MRFDTHQTMKLGQQMKLAPRMIQSMEILQMPLAQLEERIDQELESNIALELQEPSNEDGADLSSDHQNDPQADHSDTDIPTEAGANDGEDFARLDDYAEANPEAAENEWERPNKPDAGEEYVPSTYSQSRMAGERDAKTDAMASAPARAASLHDQLLDQWRLCEIDGILRTLGEHLIGFVEDDGLVRTPLTEILDKLPHDQATGINGDGLMLLERALTAIQLFLEPAGIGARDARECLLLQLDAMEEDEGWEDDAEKEGVLNVARTLIEDHLDDLMQNRLPKVAEQTGFTLDEIKAGLGVLKRLSLAPGRRLITVNEPAITPDAIVEYNDDQDRYIAYLTETRASNLQVNREYALMSKDRALEKRDRDFIKTNLSNAQWLIDAVGQRRRTLLRVISVVVDAQREYFDFGPQALKPLPMTQVAEQLGIHVATVSRAVADKHLMTPRGVVPLRRFFTGGTQTEGGEEVSWDAVKAALQEVVDAEDKAKPLSDDKLAAALKARGIDIARRTVAKYRGQLGIQSARLRKQF